MIVFYRLCDIKSSLSAKPPIFKDDQFKLNEMCLRSFVLAFGDIKPKVVFICDYCPQDKYQPLLDTVPFEHDVMYTELGINGTCLLQYELAMSQPDDVILFAECDYTWLPLIGKRFEEAIKHFKLISPYDHRNFYIDKSIHSDTVKLDLLEDHHYRTTERNTMTFGLTKDTLEKNIESFKKWGYLDNDVWKEMKERGYPLWVPIPSFATHMVEGFLSPGLDWEKLWGVLNK